MSFSRLVKALLRPLADHPRALRLANWLRREHAEARRRKLAPMGEFIDAGERRYPLLSGLRDHLKPNWRATLQEPHLPASIESRELAGRANHALVGVREVVDFLGLHGISLEGLSLVEVGAGDGANAFALAALGASRVVATEYAPYHVRQTGDVDADPLSHSKERRVRIGREVARMAGTGDLTDKVEFRLDDITSSALPAGEYDGVCSWEVLEHLGDVPGAYLSMRSLLRTDGFVFHEYNPFFSRTGGHSPCTLDFDWGHARLREEDFRHYVATLRPAEETIAREFFTGNLNRMAQVDLREHLAAADLELLELLPWLEEEDRMVLTHEVLADVRELYPRAGVVDLLARRVWVLARPQQ